jgi:hypothetical protein
MQTQIIVLVVLAGLAVFVLVIVLLKRAERARTEALQQAAATLGLAFERTTDLEQIRALADLAVFGRGHTRCAYNALSGRSGNDDVKIFDYRYTTGGGKESHTWNQTIALYPGGGRALPDFMLGPENVFHKIGQAFGYQDIDFESNPGFSSRYLLRGRDEAAIRTAFGIDTLTFLEQHLGWTVEVKAGNVGIYRAGKRCKPDDLPTFLEDSRAVLRMLTRR